MAGEGTVTVRVIGNVAGLKSAMSDAETTTKGAMGRVGASADEAGGHFNKLGGVVRGAIGTAAGLTIFAGGAAFLRDATQAATDDESAMSKLNAALQDTGQTYGPQWAQAVQKLQQQGAQFGFAAADTTTAVANLTEAGLTQSQVMTAMPAIYDLARAKNIDLATATTDVIKGMEGQGRALKELNVELPIAQTSTKSLEAAQTAYQKALEAAGPASKKAAEEVAAAQQKYNDAVKKYGDTSPQALDAQMRLEDAQQKAGQTSQAAADAYQKLVDAQNNAAGSTLNLDQVTQAIESRVGGQAQAATQTAVGAWQSFTAQMKDSGAQMMESVLPTITKLLGVIAPVITTLVQKLTPAIDAIVKAVGPVVTSLMNALMPALNTLIPAFNTIVQAVAPVITQLVNALAPAFDKLIAAIAPVIAQMVTQLAPTFTQLLTALAPLITDMVNDFLPIWKDLMPLIVPLTKLLAEILIPLLQALDHIFQGLGPPIKVVADILAHVFDGVLDAAKHVVDFFGSLPGTIGGFFRSVGDVISAPFRFAFGIVADLWNNTLGRINFTIPDWVPLIGGKNFGFPQIPKFHSGGTVPGQPGQEVLAILKAGERVTAAPGDRGSSDSGTTFNTNVYVASQADPVAIAREVVAGLRTRSMTLRAA